MTIFLLPSARSDYERSQHAVFRKVLDSICTIANQTHLQLNTVTHKKHMITNLTKCLWFQHDYYVYRIVT